MSYEEPLVAVLALMEAAYQSGVRHVCISPGSRNAPLTIAAGRHAGLRVWTLLDERGAGFFALGLAKSTQSPVALVCTSGTAVANYLPAVVEAYYSRVPLLLLTADRPLELRGIGANQTIRQTGIFGEHVKWAGELATPDGSDGLATYSAHAAARAIASAMTSPRGPVHINIPLREPLLPPRELGVLPRAPRVLRGALQVSADDVADVGEMLRLARRPLILCGGLTSVDDAQAVYGLSCTWGVPVLADPLSQLRTLGEVDTSLILDRYDAFLRSDAGGDEWTPDLIVRFGQTMTSKILGTYVSAWSGVTQIVVDEADWRDPQVSAGYVVIADVGSVVHALLPHACAAHVDAAWTRAWQERNRKAGEQIFARLAQVSGMSEGAIPGWLAEALPDGSALFVGNSMPIRDVDTFFPAVNKSIRVYANRGASGIDGIVSSALGVAAGHAGPTVLLIGDVSFYHDLGGMLASKLHGINLTIVLINNDGGGIFSFLPPSTQADVFAYFETPHGVSFAQAVATYGGVYTKADSRAAMLDAVFAGMVGQGLHVVEVVTDRAENVLSHRQVLS